MFKLFKTPSKKSTTDIVDLIQKRVFGYLKPLGFKKYGRTFSRIVDEDIVQVINFQNGCPAKGITGILWVNIGIRVPECVERNFIGVEIPKKYYSEYECNIRNRLGTLVDNRDSYYDLKKNPSKIADDIIKRLSIHVIPVFDVLCNRDAILEKRNDYRKFDDMNYGICVLDNAMIYGRRGDIDTATKLFNEYYHEVVKDFISEREINGEVIDGCVTYYKPNDGHIRYLDELADKLNIQI